MKKYLLILSALLIILMLVACNGTEANDNTSGEPTTNEKADDGFDAVRASDELWLSYGLDAYLSGEEAPDLKAFFSEQSNLTYLTLYADMFFYDEEKSVPVAEALFRFIADEYGKEALTDTERRIEYKTAYLASLGLDTVYPQSSEVEKLLLKMTAHSDGEWRCVVSIDNTTYYLKDFSQGGISQYHGLFYSNTENLSAMIEYINENLPGLGLNTDCEFNYYLTFDGKGVSYTTVDDKRMYINDTYSMLHEALHAMGLHALTVEHLWLSEGLCNYIGKLSGFDTLYASASYQIMKMAAAGAYNERAEAGDVAAIFYKRVCEEYLGAGGSLASVGDFNLVLHNDIWADLERELLGGSFRTIGDGYKLIGGENIDAVGMDLSYAEATAFVSYLVESYGMEKVVVAYKTQSMEKAFGKSYEELKALWQEQ